MSEAGAARTVKDACDSEDSYSSGTCDNHLCSMLNGALTLSVLALSSLLNPFFVLLSVSRFMACDLLMQVKRWHQLQLERMK